MPLYNVEHSFPLDLKQKTDLAERITKLHATTFSTPSIFVQVKYIQQDVTTCNHFVAGKPEKKASNRIMAHVRSSAQRTKEHFDKLGEQIENAWYVVVGERPDELDKREGKNEESDTPQSQKDAKDLLSIVFITGIIVREKGFIIPEAGTEGDWFKQYKEEFEKKADMGDESFKDMLEEIEQRADLSSWRS